MKTNLKKAAEFIAVHITAIGIGLAVIMALLPFFISSKYIFRLLILSLMYVMLSLSLNLLIGYLGQMSMGHAAFWGIGAYTAAILTTRYGASTLVCTAAAIVISGLFGLLLGLPVMKLKGYYLTIVTLGFCEIIKMIELNAMSLTRGPLGISRIPSFSFFGITAKSYRSHYYIILVLVIATAYFLKSFSESRLGLAVKAIREDESAAQAAGINVVGCKLLVFALSAMIAGVAGVFYAQYQTMVMPTQFTTGTSMQIVTFTIFGGLGNIAGSMMGAFILTFLPEMLRGMSNYRDLIYGLLIVIMMLVKPNGILGSVNFRYIRQRFNKKKEDSICRS